MRYPKYSGKPKKLKIVQIRRIVGSSMMPTLRPDHFIVASAVYRHLEPGDVIVIWHQGIEKVKRLKYIRDGKIFVEGDSLSRSTDSRVFGWLPVEHISGKVIWPRGLKLGVDGNDKPLNR